MENTKEIKIKTDWSSVTIEESNQVYDILESTELDVLEKMVYCVQILSNQSIEEINSIHHKDILTLFEKISFINKPISKSNKPLPTKIVVDNRKFNVNYGIHDFSIGQLIDFQGLAKGGIERTDYGKIMALFCIPADKKCYGKDYNVEEVAEFLYSNMYLPLALEIMAFFLVLQKAYSILILQSSLETLKKEKESLSIISQKMEATSHSLKSGAGS